MTFDDKRQFQHKLQVSDYEFFNTPIFIWPVGQVSANNYGNFLGSKINWTQTKQRCNLQSQSTTTIKQHKKDALICEAERKSVASESDCSACKTNPFPLRQCNITRNAYISCFIIAPWTPTFQQADVKLLIHQIWCQYSRLFLNISVQVCTNNNYLSLCNSASSHNALQVYKFTYSHCNNSSNNEQMHRTFHEQN